MEALERGGGALGRDLIKVKLPDVRLVKFSEKFLTPGEEINLWSS